MNQFQLKESMLNHMAETNKVVSLIADKWANKKGHGIDLPAEVFFQIVSKEVSESIPPEFILEKPCIDGNTVELYLDIAFRDESNPLNVSIVYLIIEQGLSQNMFMFDLGEEEKVLYELDKIVKAYT